MSALKAAAGLLNRSRLLLVKKPTNFDQLGGKRTATVFGSVQEALQDVNDGASVMVGGYALTGIPENLIDGLVQKGVKNLKVVSTEGGVDDFGVGRLVSNGQVQRLVCSHLRNNDNLERMYLAGELEVELSPQGTLAERIRCGGAGIAAFFTPTGCGTVVHKGGLPIKYTTRGEAALSSEPRPQRVFKGQNYIMESAIRADFALVRAWKGDRAGNLIFRKSAMNFNPAMAQAGHCTIAEVEELVETGEIPPDDVHLPSVYVERIVAGTAYERSIQRLTDIDHLTSGTADQSRDKLKERIARRVAQEFFDGMYVGLGLGVPSQSANYIPKEVNVFILSPNGILGLGPMASREEADPDLINTGQQPVTTIRGASFFSSDDSFAMIRGGHLDKVVLEAMQVSQYGDLSNWESPDWRVRGIGGAMDMVSSWNRGLGQRVVVAATHTTSAGQPRIVRDCTLPLTGIKCVDKIITELGVFKIDKRRGLLLIEIEENTSVEHIRSLTDCDFQVAVGLKQMQVDSGKNAQWMRDRQG